MKIMGGAENLGQNNINRDKPDNQNQSLQHKPKKLQRSSHIQHLPKQNYIIYQSYDR